IAHVTRRDWARRYLYERSLQNDTGGAIVLGDPGLPSASWATSEKVSEDLARAGRLSSRFRSCAAPSAARPGFPRLNHFALRHAPVLGRARPSVESRLPGG